MKIFTLPRTIVLALTLLLVQSAFASESENFTVWADVLAVNPIIETETIRRPIEVCRQIRPTRRHQDVIVQDSGGGAVPVLFGGLLGGVIGNQFGDGRGQKAMTLIGAVAGASIASNAHNNKHRPKKTTPVTSCRTDYEYEDVKTITGYDVRYQYMGRTFSRLMAEHPGDRLQLHVNIEPLTSRQLARASY